MDRVAEDMAALELDEEKIMTMKVMELKEELKRRNLRTTGRKNELLTRLKAAILVEKDRVQDDEAENDDDEAENDDEDAEIEDEVGGNDVDDKIKDAEDENLSFNDDVKSIASRRKQMLLAFHDVEGSLDKFSGDGHVNIRHSLSSFEEMSTLCGWNDVQKVAYAKRLLDGSANLFVCYETGLNSWNRGVTLYIHPCFCKNSMFLTFPQQTALKSMLE